jgi:TPP-dependent pyruvate/acetoin dehydrogenase alpha subunit
MTEAGNSRLLRWDFLEKMLLIRRFEEAVGTFAANKVFPGHYHLDIGQEATGVGAMAALGERDFIATTHRNHGHVLARGADPAAGLAEILGRETGLNRGRGGTIHLCDPSLGFLSTSGVVGSVVGLAVGGGYACKQRGNATLTAAFFGDGALEEGIAFECLNIAALWKLPVVFICENNSAEAWGMAKGGYPTLVHAANDLRSIPGSLGIEAVRVEGIDPFAVYDAVSAAATLCRNGDGPIFIEAMTKRWAGSAPLWPELATGITDLAIATGRRAISDGPHREWFETNDPVLRLARELAAEGQQAEARVLELDRQTRETIAAAARSAEESEYPAPETASHYVFAKRGAE